MATHGLDCRHWRMTPAQRLAEKLVEVRAPFWVALICTLILSTGAWL